MPTKPSLIARAAELQKRYPFFPKRHSDTHGYRSGRSREAPGNEVTVHWSLGYFREHGHTITAYCEQDGPEPMCRHSAPVDLDKAIAVFGADFIIPDAYARFVGALRCEHCGSKQISIRIGNPSNPPIGHTVPVWLMQGRG